MPQWKQYSGIWTVTQQAQAIAAGTWTGIPGYALYAWGNNSSGALGVGDTVNYSSPVQIGSDTNWLVAYGSYMSSAVKDDGTLFTWGANSFTGALGHDDLISKSSPTQVGTDTDWYQGNAGSYVSAHIKTDGTIWTWGFNRYAPLGQNDVISKSSPVQVGALTTWSQVSCLKEHTMAIKTDGTLWAWGDALQGQLGKNSQDRYSSPVQVGAETWSDVVAAYQCTLAVKTDGTLWAWGYNQFGVLGINASTLTRRSSPVQVGSLTNWDKVYLYRYTTVAIKTDGTLWTWGYGGFGTTGKNNSTDYSSPVQVGSLTNWQQVTVGGDDGSAAQAIKTDGTLWGWGSNVNGEVGDNTTVNKSSPVQIGTSTSWKSVSGGSGGALIGILEVTT